jgi:hypothetical protein
MGVVGGGEHDAALGADGGGGAVVDVGGGVQA